MLYGKLDGGVGGGLLGQFSKAGDDRFYAGRLRLEFSRCSTLVAIGVVRSRQQSAMSRSGFW